MLTPFDRQLDQVRTHNSWVSVPQFVPGRINATDYVFFNFDSSFPAHLYQVAVESMSVASPHAQDRYRIIGNLTQKVELPDVYFAHGFGSHSKILVLPVSANLPAYMGNLIRGSTYTISKRAVPAGIQDFLLLERTGVY